MAPAPLPADEAKRLAALRSLRLLDTEAEAELDALAAAAAALVEAPVALISLVDAERQWFKARYGLPDLSETPRSDAFCAHAILGDAVMEVPDAMVDPRFAGNPLVTGAHGVRFYAGAPLVLSGGERIGTLCVFDHQPRHLSEAQRSALASMAAAVVRVIEARHRDRRELHRLALADANQRMAMALDTGHVGLWEVPLGARVAHWDHHVFQQYGRPYRDAPVDIAEWQQWVHPEDRDELNRHIREAVGGVPKRGLEFRVIWPDGSIRHLRSSTQVLEDDSGQPAKLIGLNWDVTEERQLQQALARETELLRVTFESIADAVATTDGAGRVVWLNPAAEALLGWDDAEAEGRPLKEVLHLVDEEDPARRIDPFTASLGGARPAGAPMPAMLVDRAGQRHGVECTASPIRDSGGGTLGAVVVVRDVSEQRRLSREMRHRATHDALTQLLNRDELELRLETAFASARDDGVPHALLFVDLDQFKLVNDACGHAVGDQLLQQVARLLKDSVRSHDLVARLGGDEFAVLLEHCELRQAQRIAQQICDRLDAYRFERDGQRFRVGASIGLAPVEAGFACAAAVMQAADVACFAAKDAGRNRVHAWADADRTIQTRHGEMRWATRLESALDEGRFVLFRQEIRPLDGSAERHFEVLIRLSDESGVLLSPRVFLPAAERFHMATRIDRWVLREVLGRMPALIAGSDASTLVAVNLSGQSVGDRAFHAAAAAMLAEAGPAVCAALCIEITETTAVTNMLDAVAFVERLRGMGVRVALDDFGAGASSFGYLKSLPVDYLKIDGQFIQRLPEDALDQAAVRGFVDVARAVGVKTIAECVDRPAIMDCLRAYGVDYAQGFLLHRPEPWVD